MPSLDATKLRRILKFVRGNSTLRSHLTKLNLLASYDFLVSRIPNGEDLNLGNRTKEIESISAAARRILKIGPSDESNFSGSIAVPVFDDAANGSARMKDQGSSDRFRTPYSQGRNCHIHTLLRFSGPGILIYA